jgi:putative PIN family toxin of toxin-antitoxin system
VRVVLDTSTLIAAHISRAGVCSELMEDVLLHHELVLSEYILVELARTLRDKFEYPEQDVRAVVAFLKSASLLVEPASLPLDSCRDPSDIPILGTAIAGDADLLVTVDRDLLSLGSFRRIPIVKPGQFWQQGAAGEDLVPPTT